MPKDLQHSFWNVTYLTSNSAKGFGIVGMQTDDTIMIGTDEFLAEEGGKMEKFRTKPRTELKRGVAIEFHGTRLDIETEIVNAKRSKIMMRQKGQASKIFLVGSLENFVEQRARCHVCYGPHGGWLPCHRVTVAAVGVPTAPPGHIYPATLAS